MTMTNKKSYHVISVLGKDSWKVLKAGASRATKVFDKKVDAINFADAISRREKVTLFIHTKYGTVEEMRSCKEVAAAL